MTSANIVSVCWPTLQSQAGYAGAWWYVVDTDVVVHARGSEPWQPNARSCMSDASAAAVDKDPQSRVGISFSPHSQREEG